MKVLLPIGIVIYFFIAKFNLGSPGSVYSRVLIKMKVPDVYLSPTDLDSLMVKLWDLISQTIRVILVHMKVWESLF